METILAILGSSTFVGIITLMLNWAQNRKNNSLSYITEERKLWREKIRDIASCIMKCKYEGINEENIQQYLNQLELNINPYGRTCQINYLQDGHIWKVIEQIELAHSEKEFEQNKKLLLGYLSIMLKEDWERSKGEVKGYSNAILYIIIVGVVLVLYSILYLFVFKLENIMFLMCMQLFNLIPLFFTKFFVIDKMDYLQKNHNRGKIKDFLKREKERKKAVVRWTGSVLLLVGITFLMFQQIYPDMIVQKIDYYENDDTLYIYTNLDTHFWANLDSDIEKAIKKNVVINKPDNGDDRLDRYEKIDNVLLNVVRNELSIWWSIYFMLMLLCFLFPFVCSSKSNMNRDNVEINELKYRIQAKYTDDYKQIFCFLDKVNLEDKKKEIMKINADCFDLVYRLLWDMKRSMQGELAELEEYFRSVEEYEKVTRLKSNIENIDSALHRIKQFHKTLRSKKKIEIYNDIKKDIGKINVDESTSEASFLLVTQK